jgi:hypothetical protein
MRKGSLGFLLVLLGVSQSLFSQNNYSNFNQQSSRIAALAKTYPQWVKTKSLTKTAGGKDIWMITVGSANADRNPAIAILGSLPAGYRTGNWLCRKFIAGYRQ